MSSGLLPIAINSETVDSAKTRPFYPYKKKVIIPTGIVAFLLVVAQIHSQTSSSAYYSP